MQAAVEISMYPLDASYLAPIEAFIERLNTHRDIKVVTNAMSTQIFGPLDRIMAILASEIELAAAAATKRVFVMKVIPGLGAS